MTEPSLALQKAIRERLTSNATLTATVPANNILDRSARPERFPCVLLGEGYTSYSRLFEEFHDHAFADLHVWAEEEGLVTVKSIAGLIRGALRSDRLTVEGFDCRDLTIADARFMRDPDGIHSHAVVSIEAILMELA